MDKEQEKNLEHSCKPLSACKLHIVTVDVILWVKDRCWNPGLLCSPIFLPFISTQSHLSNPTFSRLIQSNPPVGFHCTYAVVCVCVYALLLNIWNWF